MFDVAAAAASASTAVSYRIGSRRVMMGVEKLLVLQQGIAHQPLPPPPVNINRTWAATPVTTNESGKTYKKKAQKPLRWYIAARKINMALLLCLVSFFAYFYILLDDDGCMLSFCLVLFWQRSNRPAGRASVHGDGSHRQCLAHDGVGDKSAMPPSCYTLGGSEWLASAAK